MDEDIADYYKGEAFVILEEFTLSLVELPRVNEYSLLLIQSVAQKLYQGVSYGQSKLETQSLFAIGYGVQSEKTSVVTMLMLIEPHIPIH